MRLGAVVLLACSLAGCDVLVGQAKSIHLASSSRLSTEDRDIIAARLREHSSSYYPRYSFRDPGEVTVIEANGAPSDETIRFLLSRRGELQVASQRGKIWFSSSDIADAAAAYEEGKVWLRLKLREHAGSRLAALSAQEVDRVVEVRLDGETLSIARITAPITTGRLQISLDKHPREALLIATILKNGPLTVVPRAIDMHDKNVVRP